MDDFSNNSHSPVAAAGGGSASPAGLDQAKALGRDLKEKASDFADTVAQTAKNQAQDLGAAAGDLANDAKGKVESALNDQRKAGADYIGSIADAIHRAAAEIDGDVPQAGRYVHQAADRIEDVAAAIRERNLRDLVGEVERFARQQPALFFGGTLLAGFAAMRFLKSASQTVASEARTPATMASSPSTAPTSY